MDTRSTSAHDDNDRRPEPVESDEQPEAHYVEQDVDDWEDHHEAGYGYGV